MNGLHLDVDGEVQVLAEPTVRHLSNVNGRLYAAATPPADDATEFGHVIFEGDRWWLHTNQRRPETLHLNGVLVRDTSLQLSEFARLTVGPPRPRVPDRPPRRPADARSSPRPVSAPAPTVSRRGRRDGRRWIIGRVGTGADIEIDDPLVRAEHAWLEVDANGRWWITAAAGPVFIDGRRVMHAVLDRGSVFVIGQTAVTAGPELLDRRGGRAVPVGPSAAGARTLRVSAGQGLSVDLRGVSVVRDGNRLLDAVDLHVDGGTVVAVVGPSGAGKSSLVKLLLGEYEPDAGEVRIGGSKGSRGALRRQQVRYVPQSDDLYPTLTVAETLTYAAQLRAARDTQPSEIQNKVRPVLAMLGLTERSSTLVRNISGGQRRRVSIGTELVGLPQLLLLDEPTSGLDAARDRDIMRRLHDISRELHCTVVVVTHSVTHLEYVDQLVVMARGGRIRYSGPVVDPTSQGFATWADWLVELDQPQGSTSPMPRRRPAAGSPYGGRLTNPPGRFAPVLLRQTVVVVRRGWRWMLSLAVLPVLGTVLARLASPDGLRPGPEMTQVLSILITVAALTGAALSYLDLVNDRAILHRDWRVGIGADRLLSAKVIVFTAICVLLALTLTFFFMLFGALPPAALGIAPMFLVLVTLTLVMVSSTCLGLLISTMAKSTEQAVTYNTVLAVLQVALNGAIFQVPLWSTAMVPARLGLGTIAAYADLNRHRPPGAYHDTLWQHGGLWVPLTLAGLTLVSVWSAVAAIRISERKWRG